MLCKEIRPLVEKLADGECKEPERQQVEAHLADCPSCQQHFRFVKALPEAARKVPFFEPPEAYWEVLPRKVMARIGKPSRRSQGRFVRIFTPARLRWMGALAAGVIAVVLSYEVLTFQPEGTPARLTEPEGEPVLEPMTDKEAPTVDALSEEGDENTDRDRVDFSSTPARQGPPLSSGMGKKQPAPRTPAPVERNAEPAALGMSGANRDETTAPQTPDEVEHAKPPSEGEVATPVAMMAEESSLAPPPGQPSPSKLEMSRPSSSEPYAIRTGAGSGERPKESLTEKRATQVRPQVARVTQEQRAAQDEKDRRRAPMSESELEAECRALRHALDASTEGDERGDLAYRLALCSIRLYRARQTEEARLQARQDAYGYIDAHSQGERADEIRRQLEELGIQR